MGFVTWAYGTAAATFGIDTYAPGYGAFAAGVGGQGAGEASSATGSWTIAAGTDSTAMGFSTTANAYASLPIGRWNTANGTPGNWVETDPLFVIGNGTDTDHRKDAFVVKKNGEVVISKRQADILMGAFGKLAPATEESFE